MSVWLFSRAVDRGRIVRPCFGPSAVGGRCGSSIDHPALERLGQRSPRRPRQCPRAAVGFSWGFSSRLVGFWWYLLGTLTRVFHRWTLVWDVTGRLAPCVRVSSRGLRLGRDSSALGGRVALVVGRAALLSAASPGGMLRDCLRFRGWWVNRMVGGLLQLTARSPQLTTHSSQLTAHSSQLTAHSP